MYPMKGSPETGVLSLGIEGILQSDVRKHSFCTIFTGIYFVGRDFPAVRSRLVRSRRSVCKLTCGQYRQLLYLPLSTLPSEVSRLIS